MTATAVAEVIPDLRETLEVKPPSESVEWLNFLIYGDPGAGKTFLAGTAEEDERTSPVLFLDIEGGVATIRHRQSIDVVRVRTLKQLETIHNTLYHSIEDGRLYYMTIVIDSLTELTDVDMRAIMKEAKGRNPDKVDIDVPSQREWGKARNHMRTIVRAFRDLPCNVIFTAQVHQLQEEGQPTKYLPGFSGKLRTEIPGFCDIVGYLYPENQQGVIIRKLQVAGTRRVVAKDRTSSLGDILENATVPEMFDLIHNTAIVGEEG